MPPLKSRFVSPLRYPGGKGKIANFIKLLFLQNDLLGSHYIEVYAGGASVAPSLLFEEFATHVHINDLDRSVHAFWFCAINDPDELCRRILAMRATRTEWRRQRAVQSAKDPEPIELAVSTFFLNRTSRSGILDGGMIGGKKQDGEWKLDARYNKHELARRINKIGRFASRITLTRLDGADYIQRVLPTLPHGLVYLDPPYFKKGQDLYQNFYQPDDHRHIAALVRQIESHKWLVSYDRAPEIEKCYLGLCRTRYSLSYSAATRYEGDEMMFFGPGLRVPKVDSPANLPSERVREARMASI